MKRLKRLLLILAISSSPFSSFALSEEQKPSPSPQTLPEQVESNLGPASSAKAIPAKLTDSEFSTPQECLQTCLKACESGDYQTYVKTLTREEQQFQAGFVLYVLSLHKHHPGPLQFLLNQNQRDSETTSEKQQLIRFAEAYLTTTALLELKQKHLPDGDFGITRSQFSNSTFEIQQQGQGNTTYSNLPNAGSFMRPSLIPVGKSLSSPEQFLIKALEIIAEPTVVEDGKSSEEHSIYRKMLTQKLKTFTDKPYVFFIRNQHAIAISLPQQAPPESQEAQAPNNGNIVRFTKIDGEWKISRLFPVE